MQLVSICYRSDDCEVRGYVGVPREEKGPLPAVIFNRGGNRAFSALRPQVICKYASQGFVVLGSQYRGNCGGTGQEEFGGADVNDVLRLIDIALELPGTFKGGVYMAGHSRGGMMTYRCCALDDRIVAAAVGSGVADCVDMYNKRVDDMKQVFQELLGGTPEEVPEEYRRRSRGVLGRENQAAHFDCAWDSRLAGRCFPGKGDGRKAAKIRQGAQGGDF